MYATAGAEDLKQEFNPVETGVTSLNIAPDARLNEFVDKLIHYGSALPMRENSVEKTIGLIENIPYLILFKRACVPPLEFKNLIEVGYSEI